MPLSKLTTGRMKRETKKKTMGISSAKDQTRLVILWLARSFSADVERSQPVCKFQSLPGVKAAKLQRKGMKAKSPEAELHRLVEFNAHVEFSAHQLGLDFSGKTMNRRTAKFKTKTMTVERLFANPAPRPTTTREEVIPKSTIPSTETTPR